MSLTSVQQLHKHPGYNRGGNGGDAEAGLPQWKPLQRSLLSWAVSSSPITESREMERGHVNRTFYDCDLPGLVRWILVMLSCLLLRSYQDETNGVSQISASTSWKGGVHTKQASGLGRWLGGKTTCCTSVRTWVWITRTHLAPRVAAHACNSSSPAAKQEAEM